MYLSLLFRGLAIPLDVDCVGGCALHTTRRVGILDGGRSDPLPPRFNESRTAVGFPATAGTGPLGHIEASRRTHRGGGGSSPRVKYDNTYWNSVLPPKKQPWGEEEKLHLIISLLVYLGLSLSKVLHFVFTSQIKSVKE